MKRIYLILLCLLCILLINSCTTEKLSSSSKTSNRNRETTQEASQDQTSSSEPENSATSNGANVGELSSSTEETVKTRDVERVEPSQPDTTPVGETGSKQITLTIVDRNGNSRDEVITTNAGDLLSALKESGKGSDTQETPGYIVTVGGTTADATKYEWWQISKDGTPLSDAADRTPITNGEHYTFNLKGPE